MPHSHELFSLPEKLADRTVDSSFLLGLVLTILQWFLTLQYTAAALGLFLRGHMVQLHYCSHAFADTGFP